MRLCNWHSTLHFGYSSSAYFETPLYCELNIVLLVRFFFLSLFFLILCHKECFYTLCPYITCLQNCLNTRLYHDYNYSERLAVVYCEQPRKKRI